MRITSEQARLARTIARASTLLALAATLGACASIPQRAWRNGAALDNSTAYRRVLSGDMSFQTRRDLQNSLNFGALGFYQEAAMYSPFPKGGWR
jgi:hypothetical protein